MPHLLHGRLRYVLIVFCAVWGLLAHAPSHPAPALARSAALFYADPRFGMDSILPDNYTKIPGINQSFPWASTAAGFGARINRFSFDWQQVEPQSGVYNWQSPEAFVGSDQAQGMITIATLEHTPSWATSVPTNDPARQVPAGLYLPWNDPGNTWGVFVATAVSHFVGRVAYWEVWNEPDILNGGTWAGTRADYFQLLKVAYLAVKAADPAAQVITGSLNYNPTWLNDVFTADKADSGAASNNYYCDVIGMHSYFRSTGAYTLGQATHQVLSQNGIPDKPVFLTELGLPANDNPPVSNKSSTGTADEVASYVIQTFASALAGGVDRMLIYRASDVGETKYWGLSKASGSARVAAAAFKVATQYMTNVQSARLIRRDPVDMVQLDEGSQHVTVLWNTSPQPITAPVYEGNASGGMLIDKFGNTTPITPGADGYYQIPLPPATDNNGSSSSDYIVGGSPYLLVESGPFVPTLTPTFTISPTPTVTTTPTPSSPVPPSSAFPTATFTNTTSPTSTATATDTSIPTATATATITSTPTFPPNVPRLYFAAGAAGGGYTQLLSVANPNALSARLHLTFSGQSGVISTTDALALPNTLLTLDLGALHLPLALKAGSAPTIGSIAVSLMVQSDRSVAGARTLYFGSSASTNVGVAVPALSWYLPGTTAITPTTQVVTVSNPGAHATGLLIQTINENGRMRFSAAHLDAYSRRDFTVAQGGHDPSLATIVTSEQPVVAEYSAYLAGPASITGATGISDLSRLWWSAEGYHNRTWGDHLIVLNPDSHFAARVFVRLYLPTPRLRQGVPQPIATATFTVGSGARAAFNLGAIAPPGAFSMALTSTVHIAVNRQETFGPGEGRAALSVGVERPAATWIFPAGDTSPLEQGSDGQPVATAYHEYLLLLNPSLTQTVHVRLDVLDASSRIVRLQQYTLQPYQRVTIDMNRVLPSGRHAAILTTTNGVRFIAEQSLYFNGGLGGASGPGATLP